MYPKRECSNRETYNNIQQSHIATLLYGIIIRCSKFLKLRINLGLINTNINYVAWNTVIYDIDDGLSLRYFNVQIHHLCVHREVFITFSCIIVYDVD